MFAVAAGAQDPDVDKLVKKYRGKEGVTVIKLDGDMVETLGEMTVVDGVDVSKVIKKVSSVTVISNETGDAEFAKDVRVIIDGKEYTPIIDVDSSGDNVKIVKKEGGGSVFIVVGDELGKNAFMKIEGCITDPNTIEKE